MRHQARSEDLPTVNRFVVVLKPTEAYLNWANSCPGDGPEITLAELREECTAYLIPGVEDPRAWIRRHFMPMFEWELAAWCTDETYWPKKRTYQLFKKFFEIEIHSIVVDLGKGPVRHE